MQLPGNSRNGPYTGIRPTEK